MIYVVKTGDSLWRIALMELGDAERWRDIAALNHLRAPDRIFLGSKLMMPARSPQPVHTGADVTQHKPSVSYGFEKRTPLVPARVYAFIVADEIDPFRRKLVRKVVEPRGDLTPAEVERIMRPDKHGFTPRNPGSNVSIGRHVGQNMTKSNYISASEFPKGAPRFEGTPYWIDAAKAEASGAKIHEASAIAKDLDRVMSKTKDPVLLARLKAIKELSAVQDREVLFEGGVSATAIKSAAAMNLTRGLQVVEGVGIVFTVYDLGKASSESIQKHSVVPIAKETVRQAGGWGGALAGAELFGAAGAAVGIETGPGAIITGAVGGLIGGIGGFFGADWAIHKLGGGK